MSQVITKSQLQDLFQSLLASGAEVAAPVAGPDGRYFFQYLAKPDEAVIDSSIMPTNSIKEFFFPKHEVLYTFKREGKEIELTDAEPYVGPQFVFGARPCDAASLPILDKVFAWDFQDRFFQSRRENTTVISIACESADPNCFCTSVGLSPASTDGADVMLLDLKDGSYEVRTLTDKGKKLFEGKTSKSDKTGKTAAPPEKKFDHERVQKYLEEHFDDPIYAETSLRCVGCGACTYICPTCHCFDIVDEGGMQQGQRVKNWDTCQFALFTHHASGHNPRSNQAFRQRNRIQHKFCIYPGKFGLVLCTGCGNCTRDCSATLGVWPVLKYIDEKARDQESNQESEPRTQ